jgi:hypothetical protein
VVHKTLRVGFVKVNPSGVGKHSGNLFRFVESFAFGNYCGLFNVVSGTVEAAKDEHNQPYNKHPKGCHKDERTAVHSKPLMILGSLWNFVKG